MGSCARHNSQLVARVARQRPIGGRHHPRRARPDRHPRQQRRADGDVRTANHHFALGLQQEFERDGVSAISLLAHPGLSNTDLQTTTVEEGGGGLPGTVSHKLVNLTGMTPAKGALRQIRVATDSTVRGGEFCAPRFRHERCSSAPTVHPTRGATRRSRRCGRCPRQKPGSHWRCRGPDLRCPSRA